MAIDDSLDSDKSDKASRSEAEPLSPEEIAARAERLAARIVQAEQTLSSRQAHYR